jgi:hypothetical protein
MYTIMYCETLRLKERDICRLGGRKERKWEGRLTGSSANRSTDLPESRIPQGTGLHFGDWHQKIALSQVTNAELKRCYGSRCWFSTKQYYPPEVNVTEGPNIPCLYGHLVRVGWKAIRVSRSGHTQTTPLIAAIWRRLHSLILSRANTVIVANHVTWRMRRRGSMSRVASRLFLPCVLYNNKKHH